MLIAVFLALTGSGAALEPSAVFAGAIEGASDDARDPSLAHIGFTLAVTGDFIPARAANAAVVDAGDFDAPLADAAAVLGAADVTFASLEAPLLEACPRTRAGMVFCGDARFAGALARAGVDVVSLATNHANNHGARGHEETTRHCRAAGLAVTGRVRGASPPAVLDVRGSRVAFLAFNVVSVGPADRAGMRDAVSEASELADIVVVQVHWGREYVDAPQRTEGMGAPDDPRALARLLVTAGADLVVGNHPHRVQGLEVVDGVPVMYAHGNLFFDQRGSPRMTESVVGLYRFEQGRVVDVRFAPLRQQGWRVRPLDQTDGAALLGRVARLSRALARRALVSAR